MASGLRSMYASIGLSIRNALDLTFSMMQFEVEGKDPTGYRIHSPITGPQQAVYVVREEDEYRILGSRESLEHVGAVVLELLEHGNLQAAQQWLDRVVKDLRADPLQYTGGGAAHYLWGGRTEASRGEEAARLAAASLIGSSTQSDEVIRLLEEARRKVTDRTQQTHIDYALCQSLEKAENWAELLNCARRLKASQSFTDDAFRFTLTALAGMKQWEMLQAEAERRLSSSADDAAALRALGRALIDQGKPTEAATHLQRLAGLSGASEDDKLLETWAALLAGSVNEPLAERLASESDSKEANYWYTLGFLQAALGKPEEVQRSQASKRMIWRAGPFPGFPLAAPAAILPFSGGIPVWDQLRQLRDFCWFFQVFPPSKLRMASGEVHGSSHLRPTGGAVRIFDLLLSIT